MRLSPVAAGERLVSRRWVLLYATAAGASLPGSSAAGVAAGDLRAAYNSIADARLFGREYSRMVPAEASHEALMSLLFGDAPIPSFIQLRAHLRHAREADFLAGRVTVVRGWVMSLTEARWCALAMFIDRAP